MLIFKLSPFSLSPLFLFIFSHLFDLILLFECCLCFSFLSLIVAPKMLWHVAIVSCVNNCDLLTDRVVSGENHLNYSLSLCQLVLRLYLSYYTVPPHTLPLHFSQFFTLILQHKVNIITFPKGYTQHNISRMNKPQCSTEFKVYFCLCCKNHIASDLLNRKKTHYFNYYYHHYF